jgi:hypothetical protein
LRGAAAALDCGAALSRGAARAPNIAKPSFDARAMQDHVRIVDVRILPHDIHRSRKVSLMPSDSTSRLTTVPAVVNA